MLPNLHTRFCDIVFYFFVIVIVVTVAYRTKHEIIMNKYILNIR